MYNLMTPKQALEKAEQLSKAGDHLSVLKLLSNYQEPKVESIRMCAMCKSHIKTSYTVEFFTDCTQHDSVDGFYHEEDENDEDYEPDWDMMIKDEEVMAEEV